MNSPNLFKRKLGKFRLNTFLIENNPGQIFTILSTVIPIRAEYMLEDNHIYYTAISHSFDVLEEFESAPEYRAVLEHGQFVRWEKVDG